jgi:hypothetical protein
VGDGARQQHLRWEGRLGLQLPTEGLVIPLQSTCLLEMSLLDGGENLFAYGCDLVTATLSPVAADVAGTAAADPRQAVTHPVCRLLWPHHSDYAYSEGRQYSFNVVLQGVRVACTIIQVPPRPLLCACVCVVCVRAPVCLSGCVWLALF